MDKSAWYGWGRRGKPGMVVSDHGTEFTCNAMLAWSKDTAIDWHFIAPGKPLRQTIAAKGALAVIPNNPSRALKHPLDRHLYAQRHLVECCFSKLKQFQRVATRFETTARNYLAVVTLAAIVLWTR